MRPLAPSEKTLFLILCGGIFLAMNMFGIHAFIQARMKVEQAIIAAKADLASDQSWLAVSDTLHPAMTWMDNHPMPQMANADDASALLLKTERDAAEKSGLKVTEENLLPSQDSSQDSSVAVEAKLSGPFEGIVRMLFVLQSPTAWRAIDKLTLRSDTQPPNVIADLQLRQYFHLGTDSSGASSPSSSPQPDATNAATTP